MRYYQVVKPLLQYAESVHSKTEQFTKLQDTIKEQDATILNLNELVKYKDSELKLQNELSYSYKSHNQNQQKLILQYENQITKKQVELNLKDNQINNLQSELKRKDNEINNLQSKGKEKDKEIYKIQFEMKGKLKEYKVKAENYLTLSCIGKLNGIYEINVPGMKSFSVSCDSKVDGLGRTIIQRRMDGSVNFNRTWSEYKEGFGNLSGEFFIGLEKLHLLTQSQPHELYIILQDFKNETRFARYSDFAISSEDEFYELKTLGEYSGDAGDAMTYKNMKFSTPDRDHDVYDGNCAKSYKSGWWFTSCHHCNLNGLYEYEDCQNLLNIIEWRNWKTDRPMKFTQMMIRPKSLSK